jgi:hypothetical protein
MIEVHFAVPVAEFPSYEGGKNPRSATDHLHLRFGGEEAETRWRQAASAE